MLMAGMTDQIDDLLDLLLKSGVAVGLEIVPHETNDKVPWVRYEWRLIRLRDPVYLIYTGSRGSILGSKDARIDIQEPVRNDFIMGFSDSAVNCSLIATYHGQQGSAW
jgi:hypothetical protein